VDREADSLDFPLEYNRHGRLVMPPDEAWEGGMRIRIDVPEDALEGCHEVFIRIDYVGDSGRLYIGNTFVHDHFYGGNSWEIGLRRLGPQALRQGLVIKLLPMRAGAPVYLDEARRIDFAGRDQVLEFNGVSAMPVYESDLGCFGGSSS